MIFVLPINFLADMFPLFGNYYFHSFMTDEFVVGIPNIMKSVCRKYTYENVDEMAEEEY
jgi:hypothetical protein